jgi:tetratricopeptide (TPR) repeat protein
MRGVAGSALAAFLAAAFLNGCGQPLNTREARAERATVWGCQTPPLKPRYSAEETQGLIEKGWAEVKAGQGVDAVETFALAAQLGQQRGDSYWGLGVASHVAGHPLPGVRACFDRAATMLPDVAGLHADYARVLQERDENRAATEEAERALALDPGNVEARKAAVGAYLALGDRAKADAHRANLGVPEG